MSTAITPTVACSPGRTFPALSLREGRRILLHPIPLALLALSALPILLDPEEGVSTRQAVAGVLDYLFLFVLPITIPFAANLVASSARRAGTEELLAALPTAPSRRALALCASGLLVAALGGIAALAEYLTTHQDGRVVTETSLGGWEAAGVAVMYLGAVAYGVMLARWLPWPGAALLGVTALVLWTMANGMAEELAVTIPCILWAGLWTDSDPGSAASDAWHAAYLGALVLLAGAAAVLRERPTRLLGTGAVLVVAASGFAVASLP